VTFVVSAWRARGRAWPWWSRWAWMGAAALGLAAGVSLYWTLAWGPWALSDSVAYVDAARGLLAGRGLVVRESPTNWVPLAHYPPLYPLLLAGLMRWGGLSWLTAARLVDAVMYGLFVALVAWVGIAARPRSPWWGLGLAVVLAWQPPVVQYMTGVMTEPPFVALALGVWAAAWAYVRTGRVGWWRLAVAAAAAGLLLRYAGLFYLAALPAALVLAPQPWRVRARRVLEAWLGLLVPYAGWNGYMRAQGNGLHFAWPTGAEVATKAQDFVAALPPVFWEGWLRWRPGLALPGGAALPWLGVVGGALAAWLLARDARRAPRSADAATAQAAALAWMFGHLYALFFFAAFLVRRPEPDFNPRVMLPWFVFGLLASGLTLAAVWPRWARRRSWPVRVMMYAPLLAALLGFVDHSWAKSRAFLRVQWERGGGYTAREWQQPETWAFLRAWPEDIPWVTNAPEPVLLWADRPAYRLREFARAMPVRGPLGYREAVDPFHKMFISGRAAALYVAPEWGRARRLYGERTDEVVDMLFRRYSPCYRDDVIELYYLGPRADALCPLGPTRYHHPRHPKSEAWP